MEALKELFVRGGPVMWPLLACSLLSLTVIAERLVFWLREGRRRKASRAEKIIRLAERGDFQAAQGLEAGKLDSTARVLLCGLENRQEGLTRGLEEAAEREVGAMRRGLSLLDTIITLAPLLGILGTVTGIIRAFEFLSAKGMADPKRVSAGIAEALITTAAGLIIAIVTLVPYNLMVHLLQERAKELAQAGSRLEEACRKGESRESPHRV